MSSDNALRCTEMTIFVKFLRVRTSTPFMDAPPWGAGRGTVCGVLPPLSNPIGQTYLQGAVVPTDKGQRRACGQPRGDTKEVVKEKHVPRPRTRSHGNGGERKSYAPRHGVFSAPAPRLRSRKQSKALSRPRAKSGDGRKTAGAAANNARRSKARAAPFPPSSAGQCLVMTMRSLCALVRCPGMIDDAGGDCPHACPRRSITAHSQPQRSHSPRQTTVPTALTGRSLSPNWPAVSRCPAGAARRRARPPAFAARARPPSAQCVSPRAPCAARSDWRRR